LNHTRQSTRLRSRAALALLSTLAISIGGCASGDDGDDPGASGPESAAPDYEQALADAPAALAKLYAEGGAIVPGGLGAYEEQLADLRGHPVVVNKWASWCGPCRFEFPFFQAQAAKRGDEMAFLGVDSNDSEDAARTFLEDYPVPYPSFSDPDEEIARSIGADYFPSTVFYDDTGQVVFRKIGPYEDEGELAADLERYAG
jgi:thiol-disulfide isomerase/thioredoxin